MKRERGRMRRGIVSHRARRVHGGMEHPSLRRRGPAQIIIILLISNNPANLWFLPEIVR